MKRKIIMKAERKKLFNDRKNSNKKYYTHNYE